MSYKIYKKRKTDDPINYRSIALISSFTKICETHLKKQMVEFLRRSKLLDPNRNAFQQSSATETTVTNLLDYYLQKQDESRIVVPIFIDLSKAFDNVEHNLLGRSMEELGI